VTRSPPARAHRGLVCALVGCAAAWGALAPQPAAAAPDLTFPWRGPQAVTGGDLVGAGPNGRAAFFESTDGRVCLVRDGRIIGTFRLPRLDGLAFNPEGALLVLDDMRRELTLHDADRGTLLDRRPVPELVPTGGRLELDGDSVFLEDVFGNRHPVATARGGRLLPPTSTRLSAVQARISVEDRGASLHVAVGAAQWDIPDEPEVALSVYGSSPPWLVVDRATTVPRRGLPVLRATREIWAPGAEQPLSVELHRLKYLPIAGVSAAPDGSLLLLLPLSEGLVLRRLEPRGGPPPP
jgi:hypothetical protein